MPPLDIQVFSPSRRKYAPSGVAVIASAATSEPASRSDSANAAMALVEERQRQGCGEAHGVRSPVQLASLSPLPLPSGEGVGVRRTRSLDKAYPLTRRLSCGDLSPWER